MIDAVLAGGAADPECQFGTDADIDMQCDGKLDLTDIQRAILLVTFVISGDAEIGSVLGIFDPDDDLTHNGCDDDDDGDTFPDVCEEAAGTDTLDPLSVPSDASVCGCPTGCEIFGVCYPPGADNPLDDCLFCDPTVSTTEWTAGEVKPCDDDNACTQNDQCGAFGCFGDPVDCDPGEFCLAFGCNGAVGCLTSFKSGPCDDGDACTEDDACAFGTCESGSDVDCNDNIACTVDACTPEEGCASVPDSSLCPPDSVCDPTASGADPTTGCAALLVCFEPPTTICSVTGESGDEIECVVSMAVVDSETLPTAAEFELHWDPTVLSLDTMGDVYAPLPFLPPSFQETPPGSLSTGHSVSTSKSLGDAALDGDIKVLLANLDDPTSPLTTATYLAGAVTGEASVLTLRFTLLQSAGDGSCPTIVELLEPGAADADANALSGEVLDQTLVISL